MVNLAYTTFSKPDPSNRLKPEGNKSYLYSVFANLYCSICRRKREVLLLHLKIQARMELYSHKIIQIQIQILYKVTSIDNSCMSLDAEVLQNNYVHHDDILWECRKPSYRLYNLVTGLFQWIIENAGEERVYGRRRGKREEAEEGSDERAYLSSLLRNIMGGIVVMLVDTK